MTTQPQAISTEVVKSETTKAPVPPRSSHVPTAGLPKSTLGELTDVPTTERAPSQTVEQDATEKQTTVMDTTTEAEMTTTAALQISTAPGKNCDELLKMLMSSSDPLMEELYMETCIGDYI